MPAVSLGTCQRNKSSRSGRRAHQPLQPHSCFQHTPRGALSPSGIRETEGKASEGKAGEIGEGRDRGGLQYREYCRESQGPGAVPAVAKFHHLKATKEGLASVLVSTLGPLNLSPPAPSLFRMSPVPMPRCSPFFARSLSFFILFLPSLPPLLQPLFGLS